MSFSWCLCVRPRRVVVVLEAGGRVRSLPGVGDWRWALPSTEANGNEDAQLEHRNGEPTGTVCMDPLLRRHRARLLELGEVVGETVGVGGGGGGGQTGVADPYGADRLRRCRWCSCLFEALACPPRRIIAPAPPGTSPAIGPRLSASRESVLIASSPSGGPASEAREVRGGIGLSSSPLLRSSSGNDALCSKGFALRK